MKKGFFKRLAVAFCIGVGCMGLLTACGSDPKDPTPESKTYTLVFDADDNANTQNITKTIEKTALNDKSEWPAVEDKDGYAGEWVVKEKVGDTYTLIANHGDGSMQDPYLVKNETQFKKMADSVSLETQAADIKYYKNEQLSTSADSDTKVTTTKYATVDVEKIEKDGVTTWQYVTRKQYFRLVDDINFSDVTIDASGYSSIELDGAKYNTFTNAVEGQYSLNNVGPSVFTDGNVFNIVVDSKYANFNINLDQKVITLVYYTSGGFYNKDTAQERRDHTQFINLKVGSNGSAVEIDQTTNNKSAFISHIMHDASFTMKDCEMNVEKINSRSGYSGIFVGGYPKTDGAVRFENCTNNADITSTGSIGIFFGNDTYKTNGNLDSNITIINCKNSGTLIGDQRSHVLTPFLNNGNQTATRFNENDAKSLDNGEAGKFEHINSGSFTAKEFKVATIEDNSIILPSEELDLETDKTYTIIVNVENCLHGLGEDGQISNNNGSFTTNINISYELIVEDEVEDFVLEDIYCSVVDVTTYCEKYDIDPETIQWQEDPSCQYYWDIDHHCFVINTLEYKSVMKTDTKAGNNVRYSVAVMDGNSLVDLFKVEHKINELV